MGHQRTAGSRSARSKGPRLFLWTAVIIIGALWLFAIYLSKHPAADPFAFLRHRSEPEAQPPPTRAQVIQQRSEAFRRDPGNLDVRLQLAEALHATPRAREVVPLMEEVVAQGVQDERVFYSLGRAFAGAGEFDAALKPLEQALALNPESSNTLLTLANVYRELDRTDEAMAAYRKVIGIDPDIVLPHRFLAFALANAGKWDEAIVEYNEILRLVPDDAETHSNLGILLNRQLKRDEAIEHLRKSAELQPSNIDALYALGYALEGSGEVAEAIEYYNKVLGINPEHRNATVRLGLASKRLAQERDDAEKKVDEPIPTPDKSETETDEGQVLLNFDKTPLPLVARFYADLTGLEFEIDDEVDTALTLSSDAEVGEDEAIALLEAALDAENLVLTRLDGGAARIEKKPAP